MLYFCKQYDLQVKWNYWRWKKTYRKQNPLKNAFLGERPFDHLQRCVKYGILPVKFPGENMIYMCQRLSRGLRVSDHFSNFSSFIINSATLSRCRPCPGALILSIWRTPVREIIHYYWTNRQDRNSYSVRARVPYHNLIFEISPLKRLIHLTLFFFISRLTVTVLYFSFNI